MRVGDSSRRCEEFVKKSQIAPLNAIIIIIIIIGVSYKQIAQLCVAVSCVQCCTGQCEGWCQLQTDSTVVCSCELCAVLYWAV